MIRKTIKILDVVVDNLTNAGADERFSFLLSQKNQSIVTTPNTEIIMAAQDDVDFKEILNQKSKLNLPDAIGVIWAGRFLEISQPDGWLRFVYTPLLWLASLIFLPIFIRTAKEPAFEKVSGSDFIWSIARIAAKEKLKLFLLGGAPTIAERTALKLQTDIYGLKVSGVYSGRAEAVEEIVSAVNKSHADILLVAFGAPKQEKWLAENLKKTTAKVGVGLGGTFDFIAGTRQRAPRWMQIVGLEWLFRLVCEPKRIVRQLAIPKFMWSILVEKLSK